jgi:fibronectin type 3 domain-containing protein
MKVLKIKSSIIYIVMMLMALNASAQQDEQIAFNGYKGNYIYNFFQPASVAHPDGDVVGFRLDRKAATETAWKTLQKFSTPATFEELSKNVITAIPQSYGYRKATTYSVAEVWPVFKKTFRYDSLGVYITQQHLALAFKLLLVDSGANKNIAYQYRVVQLKKDNSEGLQYTTAPISGNQYVNAAKPTVKSRDIDGGNVSIVYKAKVTLPMVEALQIKRQDGLRTAFKNIDLFYTIEQKADSVYYNIVDETIGTGQMYAYTITPVNRYGGGGKVVSDTVYAAQVDKNYLLPQYFNAKTDSVTSAIKLSWRFYKPELISVVKVFRSESYEDGYQLVGFSSGNDYADKNTVPGKKYYYYLTITDKLGQNSIRGSKVFALLQNTKKPLQPIYLEAKATPNGNELTWRDAGSETRGWYVYKTSEAAGDPKMYSAFIYKNVNTQMFSYTDTAKNGAVAGYALVAESFSNLRSNLTKTVYVKSAGSSAAIKAPAILSVDVSNNIYRLFWQTDATASDKIIAFNIYRKSNGHDFVKINKLPLQSSKSSFKDSLKADGFAVAYKLAAVDQSGKETLSDEYNAEGAQDVYPPSSVRSFMGGDKRSVIVNWQPTQSAAVKYEVYRFTRGSAPVKVGEVTAAKAAFKDTAYTKNTVNYYYVVALGMNNGRSAKSNETYVQIEN